MSAALLNRNTVFPAALALSKKTARYSTGSTPLGKGDLFRTPGAELPHYIRNIARALMRDGRTKSQAIRLAIGAVKRWARGGGNVSPEVRAAAAKALAGWQAARAKAKATPNKRDRVSAANEGGVGLVLATTSTSQDGPKTTVASTTKPTTPAKRAMSPGMIKSLVDRYDTVPADKRDAYRKRVIGLARAAGALRLIPSVWLSGHPGTPAGVGSKTALANRTSATWADVTLDATAAQNRIAAAGGRPSLSKVIERAVSDALTAHGVTLTGPVRITLSAPAKTAFTPSGAPTAAKRQRAQSAGNTFKGTRAPVESLADLGKAVQAYGRIPVAERAGYRTYLWNQAKKLGAAQAVLDRIKNLGGGGK